MLRRADIGRLLLALLLGLGACAGISNRLAHPTTAAPVAAQAPRSDGPAAPLSPRPAQPAPPPASGWITVTTDHFILQTDLRAATARAAAAHFESIGAALARWFGHDLDVGRTEIVLYADQFDYDDDLGDDRGTVVPGLTGTSVLIAPYPRGLDDPGEYVARGLAQRWLRQRFAALPGWLREGVTLFLGTIEVRGSELLAGGGPAAPGFYPDPDSLVPLAELFASAPAAASPRDQQTQVVTAWALTDYLLDDAGPAGGDRSRFLAWLAQLGADEPPAGGVPASFAAHYPQLRLADVDAALKARARRASEAQIPRRFVNDFAAPNAANPQITAANQLHIDDIVGKAQDATAAGRRRHDKRREFRQWQATARKNQLRFELGIGAPLNLFSVSYGRNFSRHAAVDVELGHSPFGTFASLRYRADWSFGPEDRLFLGLAIGPWYGRYEEPLQLGWDYTIHYLAANPELGFGLSTASGLAFRLSASVLLKTSSNRRSFCSSYRVDSCSNESTQLADQSQVTLLRLGLAYAW